MDVAVSAGWAELGIIRGPAGPTGPAGTDGAPGAPGPPGSPGTNGTNGVNGLSVLSGARNPTAADGLPGEFWINTLTSVLYGPKGASTWPGVGTSLVGPQGNPGTPGTNGVAAGFGTPTASGLAAGAAPTVAASGPDTAKVFAFGIPAGAQGATGPTGPAGPPVPLILARVWTPASAWPSPALPTTNTALMQIDFTPPVLNRQYRVRTTSASFIPTAATQLVMVIRATQDGSVPNNTSPILRQGVLQMPTASANFMSPLIEYVFPVTAAGTWRFLLTANVQSGTGQWQSPTGAAAGPLEMRVEDLGPLTTGNNTATGRLIGSGTAGLA